MRHYIRVPTPSASTLGNPVPTLPPSPSPLPPPAFYSLPAPSIYIHPPDSPKHHASPVPRCSVALPRAPWFCLRPMIVIILSMWPRAISFIHFIYCYTMSHPFFSSFGASFLLHPSRTSPIIVLFHFLPHSLAHFPLAFYPCDRWTPPPPFSCVFLGVAYDSAVSCGWFTAYLCIHFSVSSQQCMLVSLNLHRQPTACFLSRLTVTPTFHPTLKNSLANGF
ncbi:hypothetical protein B0H17DRAFT_1108251 [Mycena rosella]|uniref:Uncharacterized protein n=1 Tax=Mycena rosella TaxID=1033263 RepID=A0AAD7FQ99_MYCRO|nr:hypothetical protein B0H17DRAFT_1108251 [Mycena rosella]